MNDKTKEETEFTLLTIVARQPVFAQQRLAHFERRRVRFNHHPRREVLPDKSREIEGVTVSAERQVVVHLQFRALGYWCTLKEGRAVLPCGFTVLGDFRQLTGAAIADEVASIAQALEGA